MTRSFWSRFAAELKAWCEALAALDDGPAGIDDARLRLVEDELAALKESVARMQLVPLPPDGDHA
ncbi:hypothetical protein FHT98_5053 [Bosea sp. AK1]|uniref:hypothetical protein n=1 Tax=Bosea sp. AK1 TaxID=2587160 RepID=UPI000DE4F8C6|nr:hypothetical protein [Bosea sp. AK1]TQI77243.1 hypothetical protein FHT98_5053 [Bosea sp. AK1]